MSEEDELDEPRRKKKKRASDTNIYPCDDCSYTGKTLTEDLTSLYRSTERNQFLFFIEELNI